MFSTATNERLKNLVKERNTTQASLVSALVEYALERADVSTFTLESAKPRGRRPGSGKKADGTEAATAEDVAAAMSAETSTETSTEASA